MQFLNTNAQDKHFNFKKEVKEIEKNQTKRIILQYKTEVQQDEILTLYLHA